MRCFTATGSRREKRMIFTRAEGNTLAEKVARID
jgi:hypothetical protein